MIEDGAFSHKIDFDTIFKKILNLKGHKICITASKVMAILLFGWILPIGGASVVEGLQSTGLPCLMTNNFSFFFFFFLLHFGVFGILLVSVLLLAHNERFMLAHMGGPL